MTDRRGESAVRGGGGGGREARDGGAAVGGDQAVQRSPPSGVETQGAHTPGGLPVTGGEKRGAGVPR